MDILQRRQQCYASNCAQPWLREQRLEYLDSSTIVQPRHDRSVHTYNVSLHAS